MRLFFDRLLGGREKDELLLAHGQPVQTPLPYENDQAIEVHELNLNEYVLELCRLIARQAQDQPLRRSYEVMLERVSLCLARENQLR